MTVRNGTKYEGIFQGATAENDLNLSLSLARKIYDPNDQNVDKSKTNAHPVLPALLIFSKDLMEITSLNTDLTAGEITQHERDSKSLLYIMKIKDKKKLCIKIKQRDA